MAEDGKTENKPEVRPLPPIAGKAQDLEALRNAVVDAANVSGALWFSYLFVLLYLVIAVGSVTHRNLFFESPVKLPFLNVDLPLLGFFTLGPAIFLVVHAYVLLHFAMLADKVGAFHAELLAQITDDAIRTRLRRQLPSNIFVQFLAGPREVRTGLMGIMLRLIALISLVIGPLVLLVFFELQFLPYHNEAILWWQRIAILIDLALLWALWPSVARGETTSLAWRDVKSAGVIAALAASLVPIVLVFTIATFPGEWLHKNPLSLPFIPEIKDGSLHWTTPHDVLVAGDVDLIARKPTSLWANRLVWPNLEQPPANFSLRGRHLQGAALLSASLKGVDFTAARLEGANLNDSDLRDATFMCADSRAKVGLEPVVDERAAETKTDAEKEKESGRRCAQLQRASLDNAQLDRARFDGARLQGATLKNASLQGTSFANAVLTEAQMSGVKLAGTVFNGADLSGVNFESARMEGVSLQNIALSGAYFRYAQLQGAVMDGAKLQGASFRQAELQGASFIGAELAAASFDEARAQAATFDNATLDAATFINTQFQGASFVAASFRGARFGRPVGVLPQPPQLQGTDFGSADLEGAYFNTPPVWRANAPDPQKSENVYVREPITGPQSYGIACPNRPSCDWSADSFSALKQLIESKVPAGPSREDALQRIAILDPAKPVGDEQQRAATWNQLSARPKPSAGDFDRILAEHYRSIGCDPGNKVYALRRIISNVVVIFDGGNEALTQLLDTFERDPACKNAHTLSARDRIVLATMQDTAKKKRDPVVPSAKKQQ